jgi:hypothetical protein
MDKSSRHFNGQCLYELCGKDLVYVVSLSATQACHKLATSSASDGQNSPLVHISMRQRILPLAEATNLLHRY